LGLVKGFTLQNGRVLKKNMAPSPLIGYQNLEYIRSFIGNRIAWSRMNAMPIISGCFAIWRRDFVLELGGFAIEYSSEDLEFTLRAHDYLHKHPEKQYRILMLPYYVGWTEGPSTIRGLILQRNRWHRVTLEGVCLYAHMILNPKYGFLGLVTMPYFVLYEALGVFFEVASWILAIVGYFMGILNIPFFLGLLVFTMFFHAMMSMMALLTYSREQFHFKIRDILWLMVLSLLEFPLYRPLVAWARLQGTFHFLRGVRHFDRVPRTGC
jgi:cellulose synthase/poly-beta-1,6-N-acetylglucosamine synthase-like glycosyltransferase